MVPRPPPAPYSRPMPPDYFLRNMPESSMDDERNQMVHVIVKRFIIFSTLFPSKLIWAQENN